MPSARTHRGRSAPGSLRRSLRALLLDVILIGVVPVAVATVAPSASAVRAPLPTNLPTPSTAAGLRQTLNREYDLYVGQFGPINRVTVTDTGKFDEDDDPIVRRAFPRAIRLLRDDPHSATVMALERFDEESGKARKAAIFDRRVVGAVTAVTAVDTAEEGECCSFG